MKIAVILAATMSLAQGRVLDNSRSLLQAECALSCDPCRDMQKQVCKNNQLCEYSVAGDTSSGHDAGGCTSRTAIQRVTIDDGDEKGGVLRKRLQALGCHGFYTQEDCRVARLNGVNNGECWWHTCGTAANGGQNYCGEDRDENSCGVCSKSCLDASKWHYSQSWATNDYLEFDGDNHLKLGGDFEKDAASILPTFDTAIHLPVTIEFDYNVAFDCQDGYFALSAVRERAGNVFDWGIGVSSETGNSVAFYMDCKNLVMWEGDYKDYSRDYVFDTAGIDYIDTHPNDDWEVNNSADTDNGGNWVTFEWTVKTNEHTVKFTNPAGKTYSYTKAYDQGFSTSTDLWFQVNSDLDDTITGFDYDGDGDTDPVTQIKNLSII